MALLVNINIYINIYIYTYTDTDIDIMTHVVEATYMHAYIHMYVNTYSPNGTLAEERFLLIFICKLALDARIAGRQAKPRSLRPRT